jgi:hypothetical protein
MTKTEFKQFEYECKNSLITVDFLIISQSRYNFIKYPILVWICSNPNLTIPVIKWLLKKFPTHIIRIEIKHTDWIEYTPIETLITNNKLTIENFSLIIDHLISHASLREIYELVPVIFIKSTFNGSMLAYLLARVPEFDITWKESYHQPPLYYMIVSSRLLEFIQVIKSFVPTKSIIKLPESNNMYHYINNCFVRGSDKSTICALVGLCGELFPLIEIEYLTQDICNQFYSSNYFQYNPDQDPLIKLIPEQFQTNLQDVNSRGRKTKPALRDQIELV